MKKRKSAIPAKAGIHILLFSVVFFFAALALPARADTPAADQPAGQSQGWQEEFDYLCSRTQESANMSAEELKSLAERCDRLMPEIEKLEEPKRKPLLRRLKMSGDFYRFMLEQKLQEGSGK